MKNSILIATSVVAALSAAASADIVNIASNGYGQEGNGAFTGSISYSAGVLVISLTNDASTNAGGKITGLAFNINGNASAILTGTTHAPFVHLTNAAAQPFGDFERGAAMGGSWQGGGSPNGGITVGSTGTFTFNVTGPDAASLTAIDFISELSTNPQDGGPQLFVVRFRGFDNGGSDKTPGYLVPTPGTASLIGLAGLAAARRRR